ncbi:MAG: pyruvate kinase, partial [Planctomycetota bacterium]
GFPVAVLLDLSGPKIRLGQLLEDPLTCEVGTELSLIRGDTAQDPTQLTSSYPRMVDDLAPGNRVMLADGTVTLVVDRVQEDRVVCRVTSGGVIRSRQGINLPGAALSVSSMLPTDIDNARWAATSGIDMVSLSFVRSAQDVRSLKDIILSHDSAALVIAKIEKREAMEDLEAIVDASDGIMVARGDLGVEMDVSETPVAQKQIINVCKDKLKPVIVATQMLESMHNSRRPTRAEASDVANAILDGADACMLSGETAIGQFPLVTVETMEKIMRHTEKHLVSHDHTAGVRTFQRVHPITSAVTHSATNIAEAVDAKLIVIGTRSGGTAWVKSAHRSRIPTLAVSDNLETLRRINLFWGVRPVQVPQLENTEGLIDEVCRWGCENGFVESGSRIVFVTGRGVGDKSHSTLLVHTV